MNAIPVRTFDDFTLDQLKDFLEAVKTFYEEIQPVNDNERLDEHRQFTINGCRRTINDCNNRIATFNIKTQKLYHSVKK